MTTHSNEITTNELKELNDKYRSLEFIDGEFYKQLTSKGFDVQTSILVEICPDGDNTYIGKLISTDGEVYEFDMDLDDEKYSIWNNITPEYNAKLKCNSKKYLKYKVAMELWRSK